MKITDDIAKRNGEETLKNEEVFRVKTPIITYILIFYQDPSQDA